MAWLENTQVQDVLNKLYDGTERFDNAGIKIATNETKKINSLFNAYKKPQHTKNIKYTSLEDFLKDGWTEGNRTHNEKRVNVTKEKPSSEKFENEVWCMFYKVGIRYLNFDNQLILPFDKDPQSHKQIDIFAIDTENKIVFLVECKASENDKRKSFKTEIESLDSMKLGFTKSIHQIFGNDFKVKLIFATKKYLLKKDDEDSKRLKKSTIYHLNDNKLTYLNNILANYSSSAKYQFLGHIFKGEKINDELIKIPALKGMMGDKEYYMFSLEPSVLLQIGYVLHRVRANEEDSPTYQRMLVKSRLKNIGIYLDQGNRFFPNSIIINFKETKVVKVQFKQGENSSDTISNSRFGMIEIPMAFAIANIIDGQHRVYGYSASKYFKKDTIPVVAFKNMTTPEQLEMFIDVNQNQKSISPDLIDTLKENLQWDDDNYDSRMVALRSSITRVLGETEGYALSGLITQGGDTADLRRRNFSASLLACGLIPKANKKSFKLETARSSLYDVSRDEKGLDTNKTMENARDRISRFINRCFEFVLDNYPQIFNQPMKQNYIVSNKGIYAFIMIIGSLNDFLTKEGEVSIKTTASERVDKMDKYLDALCDGILNKIDESTEDLMIGPKSKEGDAARPLWTFTFGVIINDVFPEYEIDGLQDWKDRKNQDLQQEGYELVTKIEVRMKEVTIQNLKLLFGEKQDASGTAAWEYEIGSIRRKCNARLDEKQQEEHDSGATPKAYDWTDFFDIVDYGKIFQAYWAKPGPEEKDYETFQELMAYDMGNHKGSVIQKDEKNKNKTLKTGIYKEAWEKGIKSGEYPEDSRWHQSPVKGYDHKWVTTFNSYRQLTAHSGSKSTKVGLTQDEVNFLKDVYQTIS